MKSQILLLILSASLVACGTSKKTSASNRDLNKQPEQVTEDTEKKEDHIQDQEGKVGENGGNVHRSSVGLCES